MYHANAPKRITRNSRIPPTVHRVPRVIACCDRTLYLFQLLFDLVSFSSSFCSIC